MYPLSKFGVGCLVYQNPNQTLDVKTQKENKRQFEHKDIELYISNWKLKYSEKTKADPRNMY